jgi:hypothetical protein
MIGYLAETHPFWHKVSTFDASFCQNGVHRKEPDKSVDIAAGYWLDGRGSAPGSGKRLFIT